jgi:exopolyphosphatase/guanosine-5'-triphosphate,3'-diphosphate pyrophosphatase
VSEPVPRQSGETAGYAVIDVGTNSVKLHVAQAEPGGGWRTLVDRSDVTRLGEGMQSTGAIERGPLRRTIAAIEGMVAEARGLGVRSVAAVGTAALRSATNRDEVVAAIADATGVEVEVVSGEEESRLAYRAVLEGIGTPEGPLVVFDTGGGSSQFTFGRGARVDERFSVPVGAARYTEQFGLAGAVAPDVVGQAQAAISADLSRLHGRPMPDTLVGMGGSITAMTAVMLGLDPYDPDAVQGARLGADEVDRQIALYASQDAEARRAVVGLQPNRAEVILAGACVVSTVLRLLGQPALVVSDRSLRHGLLAERFGSVRS